MDPEATLAEIRAALYRSDEEFDGMYWDELRGVVEEVADYFAGLDEWLSKGGFLPRDWSRSG